MKVLVTGGAGYIGSTVASALVDAGHKVVILDDFSSGPVEFVLDRPFYAGDVADGGLVDRVFSDHPDVTAVVHCAASIVVPESVRSPLSYYRNNVGKTMELVEHLVRNRCRRLVFSSTAAIYAAGPGPAVDEDSPLQPNSPYANSKLMVERVLKDVAGMHAVRSLSLRYFNPVGADPGLRTGPYRLGHTQALGRLLDAAAGGEPFVVAGTDWATHDGTAIRDYIHVWDLAVAHVRALERFDEAVGPSGFEVVNIGTGSGTTVRELVAAFAEVVGRGPRVFDGPRRAGDVRGSYTVCDRAERLLGWRAQLDLRMAIADSLRWQTTRAVSAR